MFAHVAKPGLTVATPMRQSLRNLYPTYHKHLVGAPRTRIGFAEKAFWGGVFVVGILAAPAWVLVNLESYKGKQK